MYNANGPPKGFNVTSDQSSYDLVSKDIIVCSNLGTPDSGSLTSDSYVYSFDLGTDNMNQIYKTELVSAAIAFSNATIPDGAIGTPNIKNKTLIVSVPQLNQNTFRVATPINNSGVTTQGAIFCQIPDNSTPITPATLTSNGIISLYIGARMFDTVQYYNPPLSKLNRVDISFFDTAGQPVLINETSTTDGVINTFYFTLRVYYFQKRNNTSSFSTSVFNYTASGTIDSIYQPYQS
jgi:hypothetical protein